MKKFTNAELAAAMQLMTKNIQHLTDEMASLRKRLGVVEGAQQNHRRDIDLLSSLLETPDQPAEPKEYVLTDADWQRVIDEGWLCEFGFGAGDTEPPYRVCELARRSGVLFVPHYPNRNGTYYHTCRPLNKPGVMQPYFGQGCPVPKGDVVIVLRRGIPLECQAMQVEADPEDRCWTQIGSRGDVVAYMVVPRLPDRRRR